MSVSSYYCPFTSCQFSIRSHDHFSRKSRKITFFTPFDPFWTHILWARFSPGNPAVSVSSYYCPLTPFKVSERYYNQFSRKSQKVSFFLLPFTLFWPFLNPYLGNQIFPSKSGFVSFFLLLSFHFMPSFRSYDQFSRTSRKITFLIPFVPLWPLLNPNLWIQIFPKKSSCVSFFLLLSFTFMASFRKIHCPLPSWQVSERSHQFSRKSRKITFLTPFEPFWTHISESIFFPGSPAVSVFSYYCPLT